MATLLRRKIALDDELVVVALERLTGGDWTSLTPLGRLAIGIFVHRACSDLGDRPYEDIALRRRLTSWTGRA